MKCPTCKDVSLVITDRQGIEIDYCPECRGIWLDRGELDKIIERSGPQTGHRSEGAFNSPKKGKKPKSFLGELLDF